MSKEENKIELGPFQQTKNPAKKTFWPRGPVRKIVEGPWAIPEKRILMDIHKCIHTVYSIYLTLLDLLSPPPV